VRDSTKKFKPNDGRIQVRFSPEEITAAKERMRQLGIGTFGDYVRWVLRGALQSKPPAPRTHLPQD
jgi:predicted DNA binding CopG/RHH family protein